MDNPHIYLKNYKGFDYLSDDLDGAPLKIGASVIKINSQPNDNVRDGTKGKIIGSISTLIKPEGEPPIEQTYFYTVIWEYQGLPVQVIGNKLKLDKS